MRCIGDRASFALHSIGLCLTIRRDHKVYAVNYSNEANGIFVLCRQMQEDEVGCAERNDQVEWFLKVNEQFKFNPETVVLCIAIFDHFMNIVKVGTRRTPLRHPLPTSSSLMLTDVDHHCR